MPTVRQRKVARRLIEALENKEDIRGGALLKSVDYGIGLQRSPARVLESEGVKEALADLGFSEEGAKSVVSKILYSEKSKDHDRLDAADKIFKVCGSYAPEKNLNINLNSTPLDSKSLKLALEYENKLKEQID